MSPESQQELSALILKWAIEKNEIPPGKSLRVGLQFVESPLVAVVMEPTPDTSAETQSGLEPLLQHLHSGFYRNRVHDIVQKCGIANLDDFCKLTVDKIYEERVRGIKGKTLTALHAALKEIGQAECILAKSIDKYCGVSEPRTPVQEARCAKIAPLNEYDWLQMEKSLKRRLIGHTDAQLHILEALRKVANNPITPQKVFPKGYFSKPGMHSGNWKNILSVMCQRWALDKLPYRIRFQPTKDSADKFDGLVQIGVYSK